MRASCISFDMLISPNNTCFCACCNMPHSVQQHSPHAGELLLLTQFTLSFHFFLTFQFFGLMFEFISVGM